MSAPESFFDGVAQSPIEIRGQPCQSPAFYRDLGMMMAVLTCDPKAARALLPTTRLEPLTLLPGVGLLGINCFEYRDTDIGPYNEVGLSVAVRVDGGWTPGWVQAARANLSRRYHGFVADLPVDTEIAVAGGLDYFNYPKYLTQIDFLANADRWECTVRDPADGLEIYSFAGARLAGGTARQPSRPEICEFFSYPVKDGRLMRARFAVNLLQRASSRAGSAFQLRPTGHPRARDLASLGPGRLLYYQHAPRCEGILYPPEPI
jgi:hypothetical protein